LSTLPRACYALWGDGGTLKAYPSDVSDDEWAFVAPYLTLPTEDAPQRTHSLCEVFKALRWLVRAGSPPAHNAERSPRVGSRVPAEDSADYASWGAQILCALHKLSQTWVPRVAVEGSRQRRYLCARPVLRTVARCTNTWAHTGHWPDRSSSIG
jgi:hypothetical protein